MPMRKNIWKENLTTKQINDAENKLKEYLAKKYGAEREDKE